MARPSVCLVGDYKLPILAPEFGHPPGAGGEQVQHTLLTTTLAARDFEVSVYEYDLRRVDTILAAYIDAVRTFARATT